VSRAGGLFSQSAGIFVFAFFAMAEFFYEA